MRAPSAEFEAYLAPGETVVETVQGRFVDGSTRSSGTIGVTDRRLLFVSDGERFEAVTHDAVCSIRSHRRSSRTAAGLAYPLLAVAGTVVAAVALLFVVSLRPGTVTLGLTLVAVGGAVAADWLRRSSIALGTEAPDAVYRLLRGEGTIGELTDVRSLRRGDGDGLVVATAIIALLGLVGLVAVTGTLTVVPLTLAALVALGFAGAASSRARRLAAAGAGRREERAIHVDLVNGRSVDITVDTGERIDRALSGVVREPLTDGNREPAISTGGGAAGSQD